MTKFKSPEQAENKYNCLKRHGKTTPEYCIESRRVTAREFFYPLQNKYKCLSDPNNHFDVAISTEASDCLGIFDEYPVEKCLEAYENTFASKMGFVGTETEPF